MQKILLVEDETDLREFYVEFLQSEGFEVAEAADGEQGLSLAFHSDWDLMLLDIMLPKLDGIEVLKKLSSNNEISSKPVLLLTNLDKVEVVDACMALGARDYIVKSNTTPDVTLQKVKQSLPVLSS